MTIRALICSTLILQFFLYRRVDAYTFGEVEKQVALKGLK
jgi:hypothetical protein